MSDTLTIDNTSNIFHWLNGEEIESLNEILWTSSEVASSVYRIINLDDFWKTLSFIKSNMNRYGMKNMQEEMRQNLSQKSFLDALNEYIRLRFNYILTTPSINSYEELSFLMFLINLSAWFEDYNWNLYDIDNYKTLFEKFTDKITNSGVNSTDIDSFLRTSWILNLIWIINQNQGFNDDFILKASDLINEKIDELFRKVEVEWDQHNSIEYYKWLTRVNFSYLSLSTKKDDLNYDSFKYALYDTKRWYDIAVNSEFWWQREMREKTVRSSYALNSNFIIWSLLNFIKNQEDFFSGDENRDLLEDIISFYKSEFPDEKINIDSIDSLRKYVNRLLYKYIHGTDSGFIWRIWESIIELWDAKFWDHIEIIYNVLLFNNIDLEQSKRIWERILAFNLKNSRHEAIRIKMLQIIIERLSTQDDKFEFVWFIEWVWHYIETNKVWSSLLDSFAWLYLSIAYFYSCFKDNDSKYKSLKYLYKYKKIHPNSDSKLHKTVSENLWELKTIEILDSLEDINDISHDRDLVNSIKWKIESLITSRSLNLPEVNQEVSKFFSMIFHWIVIAEVVDTNSEKTKNEVPVHFEQKTIVIENWFKLILKFPKIFSKKYERVFGEEKRIIDAFMDFLRPLFSNYNEENKADSEKIKELEEALKNWATVEYQSIHDIERKIVKFEALTRINGKSIHPYILVCNKHINSKDNGNSDLANYARRVLRELLEFLLKQISETLVKYPTLPDNKVNQISINLEDANLNSDYLFELIKKYSIDPKNIIIEIVEASWLRPQETIESIRKLKKQWFSIYMDDYWTWNATYERCSQLLKENLLDWIKIDWILIRDLNHPDARVRRMAKLAIENLTRLEEDSQNPNLVVIAEQVETQADFEELRKSMVIHFQWYYFSKAKGMEYYF